MEKIDKRACIEYLQALSRLYEAEIRLDRSQHAGTGFMAKVQKRILTCEKTLRTYEMKHKYSR